MPQPLHLTDAELDVVMSAAAPLAIEMRDPFLLAVAHALAGRTIGPGEVYRTCRELQRSFFDPPLATEVHEPRHDRTRTGEPIGEQRRGAR